ncbi:MAG: Calx-beta domain-containing protein, partial [Balneolaceae bacterium]|nr:Calx-beta domain-containing protein [Balneolaceae bacterium]
MRGSSTHIIGSILFAGLLAITLTSCEDMLIGTTEEGQAVQMHVQLYNSEALPQIPGSKTTVASTAEPVVNQIRLIIGEVTLGNKQQEMFSFMLDDSPIYLADNGESLYLGEKVIPEGVYHNINMLFGDTSDPQSETGETTGQQNVFIAVSGVYNDQPFEISTQELQELNLDMRPPLNVNKNPETVNVITLAFDTSKWFVDGSQSDPVVLDPLDDTSGQQIIENILASANLEQTKTKAGNNNRGNRGNKLGLSISDAEAPESDGVINFTVELNSPTDKEVTVDFSTADMSAKAGEDFVEWSETLVFSPNQTELTVRVELLDDDQFEQDERFAVKLSNPVNAELIKSAMRANGIILNDDEKSTGSGGNNNNGGNSGNNNSGNNNSGNNNNNSGNNGNNGNNGGTGNTGDGGNN